MNNFKVGDKVKFINDELHNIAPSYYPKVGTVGEIVKSYEDNTFFVQWPEGTTSDDDFWYVGGQDIELVAHNVSVSDDQIWGMLKPKMEKLNINPNGNMEYLTFSSCENVYTKYTMPIEDVKRLVATVYRSGYGRGKKNRPFIIGEKKGYWKQCESDYHPSVGTKLRRNSLIGYNYFISKIPCGTIVNVTKVDNWTDGQVWVTYPNAEKDTMVEKIYIAGLLNYFDRWVEE